jgi:hypothetical protein
LADKLREAAFNASAGPGIASAHDQPHNDNITVSCLRFEVNPIPYIPFIPVSPAAFTGIHFPLGRFSFRQCQVIICG